MGPGMIARGLFHLMQSTEGDELSVYHLQASIAACHCAAGDYESTDWHRILHFYDLLVNIDDSPVVALNRSVAVSYVHGPKAAIEAINMNREQLDSYYLLYAVLGELEEYLNNRKAARKLFPQIPEPATISPSIVAHGKAPCSGAAAAINPLRHAMFLVYTSSVNTVFCLTRRCHHWVRVVNGIPVHCWSRI